MREPHQIRVGARRVDHHDVVVVLDGADRDGEACELLRLVSIERVAFGARYAIVRRHFQLTRALRPGAASLDVMRETLLTRVEIDRGDALASLKATAMCNAVVDFPEPPFSLPSTTAGSPGSTRPTWARPLIRQFSSHYCILATPLNH
jgi:hypothetical protein